MPQKQEWPFTSVRIASEGPFKVTAKGKVNVRLSSGWTGLYSAKVGESQAALEQRITELIAPGTTRTSSTRPEPGPHAGPAAAGVATSSLPTPAAPSTATPVVGAAPAPLGYATPNASPASQRPVRQVGDVWKNASPASAQSMGPPPPPKRTAACCSSQEGDIPWVQRRTR